jgi:hypothetical protein
MAEVFRENAMLFKAMSGDYFLNLYLQLFQYAGHLISRDNNNTNI